MAGLDQLVYDAVVVAGITFHLVHQRVYRRPLVGGLISEKESGKRVGGSKRGLGVHA